MKKFVAFFLPLVVLSFATRCYGRSPSYSGVYLGVGGSYALEEIDVRSATIAGQKYKPHFDDTWGVNTKLGYHFNDWFALQLDLDFLSDFESEDKKSVSGTDTRFELDLKVTTVMGSFKLSKRFWDVEPFFVGGLGMMHVKSHAKARNGVFESESSSETDTCTKVGAGLDVHLRKHLTAGLEVSHVWGLEDLDDVEYSMFTLGLAYHF